MNFKGGEYRRCLILCFLVLIFKTYIKAVFVMFKGGILATTCFNGFRIYHFFISDLYFVRGCCGWMFGVVSVSSWANMTLESYVNLSVWKVYLQGLPLFVAFFVGSWVIFYLGGFWVAYGITGNRICIGFPVCTFIFYQKYSCCY